MGVPFNYLFLFVPTQAKRQYMRNLALFWKYIKYRLSAKTRYDVHSPFLFALVEEVFRNKGNYYAYDKIEPIRRRALQDNRSIAITDLGAGSRSLSEKTRTVSAIARTSVMPIYQAQRLHRVLVKFRPQTVLEIGTSLGITTMYLAAANQQAEIITLEGCPNTRKIALEHFAIGGFKNIRSVEGNFDDTLPQVLQEKKEIDFALIDGNHRKEATLRYFHEIAEHCHSNSILVFDDIHWSDEMEEAWNEIIRDERITLSLDLFHQGMVFFKKELKKEHYVLKHR